MESISDSGISDNSDEQTIIESTSTVAKDDESVCRFRGDDERFRGDLQHPDTQTYSHCPTATESIIHSIISDDQLARQVTDLSPEMDRSRSRGWYEQEPEETSTKPKLLEKAKPGLPEAGLLQEATGFTATTATNWNVIGGNNNVVEHGDDSCLCMSADEGMYADSAYYSQDSF